jgi:hypothetical protein
MNKLITIMAAVPLFCMYMAVAEGATPQQQKMKACNAEAGSKELKGEERQAFMKSCLSAKAPEPMKKATPQQEKMKACNKEAAGKQLKGDERKKFMSSCLSA